MNITRKIPLWRILSQTIIVIPDIDALHSTVEVQRTLWVRTGRPAAYISAVRVHWSVYTHLCAKVSLLSYGTVIWEFPKIRGTFFGGPYDKDPTI